MQLARLLPHIRFTSRSATSRVVDYFNPVATPVQKTFLSTSKNQEEDIRGLPAPPTDGAQKLDISSDEGIRFDHLGPIVVNKDGTMSRITNWDKMAPIERENTLRILGKRNKVRMDKLKKEEAEMEKKNGS